MGKYEPLQRHLMGLRVGTWRASFDEVEAILGFPLPRSAFRYPAWWSNDATGHSHSRAWLDAGWKTESVDIEGRALTFRAPRRDEVGPGRRDTTAAPSIELFGALAGTVRVGPDTDLTEPTGEAWSAGDGRSHE